jgi:ketosteroid isomerase-like protein
MSQELIAMIERGHQAFNTGDLSLAKSDLVDDVEWGTTGTWPGLEGTYRGPDALDEWMKTLRSEWETFQVSLDEVIADAGDVVAVAERLSGRGKESGIDVEMQLFSVYWVEGDKIARRQSHRTREEALAALEAGKIGE